MKWLLVVLMFCTMAAAQELAPKHRFWDAQNKVAIGVIVTSHVGDMITTWKCRQLGCHEQVLSNSFVDNKPLFATESALVASSSVVGGFFLHRTHHHKLERIWLWGNSVVGVAFVAYNIHSIVRLSNKSPTPIGYIVTLPKL